MKLWILDPITTGLEDNDNPWKPWYDKAFGFVVRAESEEKARVIANDSAGDENNKGMGDVWLDDKYTTCVDLSLNGEAEIIMSEYAGA